MKTLLKCALMASALVLSGSAMAEDGFDQTPLARQVSQHDESADGSSERFAEMLERQPSAAGQQPEPDESEPRQHRKRSGSYDQ
nr:hypothetical protein [uncultured Pseudomonas sp.]